MSKDTNTPFQSGFTPTRRSLSLNKSLKRKFSNVSNVSVSEGNNDEVSANDTLVNFLDHLDAAEKEASQSNVKIKGLSPIAPVAPVKSVKGVTRPTIPKSEASAPRCLIPVEKMLDDSLDILAVEVPNKTFAERDEEQDLFAESPKCNNKSLYDSGCEGSSLDEEEEKPWEYSVYVHPKGSTSPKMCSETPKLRNVSGIQQILVSCNPQNKTKHDTTLHGINEINWDDSMRIIADRGSPRNDSPKSMSFSQHLHQKFLSNNNNAFKSPQSKKDSPKPSSDSTFFGLPDKVRILIEKFRGIKNLYDWQRECLSMPEVQQRKNLVYALPTSGGKTLVAEILLLKEILNNKKNTLFILPYVSIVQEKVRAFSQLAVELDFFIEEYAGGKGVYPPKKHRFKNGVYVATIEKALGLVHSFINENRLHEIGLVVVDELHLLGEGSRGATLEAVLTNLRFCQGNVQIVGMSATIGNLEEIASFLDAKTYTGDFRPVELKEFVKCGQTIYSLNRKLLGSGESPLAEERTLESHYSSEQLQADPDQIGALVAEVIPDDSCLVFCPSRKNCENVALLIIQTISKNLQTVRVDEKKALFKALNAEGNGQVCPILFKTLPYGVAYHHSGLTTAERRLLEEAFLAQTLCVICCTSTLAAGVNLPARRVILRSPYIGLGFMDLSRYKQMIGRAGRAGFGGVGESILMCVFKDTGKVLELLTSNLTESLSFLAGDGGAGLKALVLHSISLRLTSCRSDIHAFLKHTLLWVQAEKQKVDVLGLADICIQSLLSEGAFTITQGSISNVTDSDQNVISALVPTKDKLSDKKLCVQISLSTPLNLSRIGEAAVKGSFTIQIAHRLYHDLHLAQEKLVLVNHLHLLYVVTPYSMVDQIKYTHQVYFNVYMDLSADELKVANAIGISEAVIVSVMKRRIIKAVPQEVVDRFYLTLMLYDLWHRKSIWEVSHKYQVSRGQIFSLLQAASGFASCVLRYCEMLEEFWCYRALLEEMTQRLSHCCATELIPLMELPAVKIGRARQLYNAGYRTLRDVACAEPIRLLKELDHMPKKTAYQIVAAAKLLIIQKAESLRDEASDYLDGLSVNIQGTVTPST